jgi:hypothetical protein
MDARWTTSESGSIPRKGTANRTNLGPTNDLSNRYHRSSPGINWPELKAAGYSADYSTAVRSGILNSVGCTRCGNALRMRTAIHHVPEILHMRISFLAGILQRGVTVPEVVPPAEDEVRLRVERGAYLP